MVKNIIIALGEFAQDLDAPKPGHTQFVPKATANGQKQGATFIE
jgi:hypothetical protein